ncbi:hypothetical protein PIGBHMHK_00685 [Mycoplasmopsis arginini]|nr:hypothetical protein [Mycoplasmopsis arginini]
MKGVASTSSASSSKESSDRGWVLGAVIATSANGSTATGATNVVTGAASEIVCASGVA